ncbi:MAG TPA: hypothetical protein VKU00_30985 [Chthonomonadaceae bacterium]|nr:hypothetical protein [Chthonomonadaceae bacterium]
MDVYVQGKGKVSLSQSDFVAQGGEGAVYARGDIAYKIYASPDKMIPVAKIRELARLTDPNIVRPQDVLLGPWNRPIGYTMRRVQSAHSLCQVFTRAFRERQGLTLDTVVALVQQFQRRVQHVHTQDMLIVDLNEMNFLLDRDLREILFLDVDSYQTPGFPATALMETVRDRHSSRFSRDTDWFSWGIVTFQMFIGIHPYKGTHKTLTDLDARMHANVSVFHRDVAIPKVCYPFDTIPQAYRDWYRAVFDHGKRLPPPTDLRAVVVIAPQPVRVQGTHLLHITELYRFPAEVVAPVPASANDVALTVGGLYIKHRQHPVDKDARVVFTVRTNHIIAASVRQGRLKLVDITQGREIGSSLAAEALTTCGNRLMVKQGGTLYEVEFVEFGVNIQAALKPIGNALENATQLFEGVAVQSLLGACYVSLSPQPGTCYAVHIAEMDGYQIVDARFDNNVLMLIGTREGRYDKCILRFDPACRGYDIRLVPDIAYIGLNFVTLDNGLCIHVNENEELEIFSHRKDIQALRVLADPAVPGRKLFKNGTQVLFAQGDRVYSLSLHS